MCPVINVCWLCGLVFSLPRSLNHLGGFSSGLSGAHRVRASILIAGGGCLRGYIYQQPYVNDSP